MAREYYASSFPTEVQVSVIDTPTSVGSLTFPAAVGKEYIVFWSVEARKMNVTNISINMDFTLDGVVVDTFLFRNRLASEYHGITGFFKVVGDGSTHVADLIVTNTSSAINPSATRNLRFVAMALGPNDIYAESLDRVDTTTATATVPLVTATHPSAPAGDFLLFGGSGGENNNVTAPIYADLSTSAGYRSATYMISHAALTDIKPIRGLAAAAYSGGGAFSVTWGGRSHSGGAVCYWRNNRVLALYLPDFDGALYTELASPFESMDAGFVDALSVTGTTSANPKMVFSNFPVSGNSTALTYDIKLQEDSATDLGISSHRVYSSTTRAQTNSITALREGLSAGSHKWALQRQGDGVNTLSVRPGAAIAVLDLGTLASTVEGVGAAAGSGVAIGVGASTKSAAGAAAGVGTATAVGRAIKPSVAAGAGVGDATAVGRAIASATAVAAGIGNASGVSAGSSVAVAAGVGNATGVGESTRSAAASAPGSGVAIGVGAATASTTAGADGVGVASAVGRAIHVAVGTSAGLGVASGSGASTVSAVAQAAGLSIATGSAGSSMLVSATFNVGGLGVMVGVGAPIASGAGVSAGLGNATAVGRSFFEATALATGAGVAAATGRSFASAAMAAFGLGTATAVGNSTISSQFTASGIAAAFGVGSVFEASPVPSERLYAVLAEGRSWDVPYENRLAGVNALGRVSGG